MPARRLVLRGAAVLLALLLLAALVRWLSGLGDAAPPRRQVARIALLPDQPPPPPPPPKEERPPPKETPRPQPQPVPQPQPPQPANEPLKMEGEAGSGPSAFAAGSVANEYAGGAVPLGPAASAGGGRDRALERLYAGQARQLLRDALERRLGADVIEVTAEFRLWVQGDGRIGRHELQSSGDAALDRALTSALEEAARELRLPPPPPALGGGEPMRFRMTVRPQAG